MLPNSCERADDVGKGKRRLKARQLSVKGLILVVACASAVCWSLRSVWFGLPTNRSVYDLRYGNVAARRQAVVDLSGGQPQEPATASALIAALHDEDPAVRAGALYALRMNRTPMTQMLPLLLAAMHDRDATVRIVAAQGLPRQCLPELQKALDDRDARVRAAAAKSLANFSPLAPQVVARLMAALDDPDGAVNAAALQTLGRTTPDPRTLRSIALAALNRREEGTCALAAEILVSGFNLYDHAFGDLLDDLLAKTIPALIRVQDDPSPRVRIAASRALTLVREHLDAVRFYHRELAWKIAALGGLFDTALAPARTPMARQVLLHCSRLGAIVRPALPAERWLFDKALLSCPTVETLLNRSERMLRLDPESHGIASADDSLDEPIARAKLILSESLASDDPALRRLAADALGPIYFRERDESISPGFLANLRRAVEKEREPGTSVALDVLGRYAGHIRNPGCELHAEAAATQAALVALISHGVPEYQLSAARVFGSLGRGADKAVPALRTHLQQDRSANRFETFEVLLLLSNQLESANPAVRQAFADTVPLIVKSSHDPNPVIRGVVAQCLSTLGRHIESAALAAEKMRDDPDPEVRRAASGGADWRFPGTLGSGARP